MLKRLGQQLRLGVAASGVALVRTSIWRRAMPEVLAERVLADGATHETVAAAVGQILAEASPRGKAVAVVLADDLTRIWQVAPPAGCVRVSDLQAAVSMRFQALFGPGTAGWRIAADLDAARPFLAAAAPAPLLGAIEAAVRAQGGEVVDLVPQFIAALNEWRGQRRRGAWFGMVQSGVLTLALFDGASFAAVRSVVVPRNADREWLDAHVAREALRVGIERPDRVQVCGSAPVGWTSDDGRLKYNCTLLSGEWLGLSELANIACTGSPR